MSNETLFKNFQKGRNEFFLIYFNNKNRNLELQKQKQIKNLKNLGIFVTTT